MHALVCIRSFGRCPITWSSSPTPPATRGPPLGGSPATPPTTIPWGPQGQRSVSLLLSSHFSAVDGYTAAAAVSLAVGLSRSLSKLSAPWRPRARQSHAPAKQVYSFRWGASTGTCETAGTRSASAQARPSTSLQSWST